VPFLILWQVGDPKFAFEAKTIQRMELLVLDTLSWKMNAVTPCSLLEHILKKLSDVHHDNSHSFSTSTTTITTTKVVNRSMQLILSTIRGTDYYCTVLFLIIFFFWGFWWGVLLQKFVLLYEFNK